MKHKIIGVAGIAISILIALWESLEVLYNYGSSGLAFYHSCYASDEFLWTRIESEDWVGFTLCALWYFFLIIPWVQYFRRGFRNKSFGVTLTGRTNFSSVFFTVFNVAMIIGSAFLLSHPNGYDQSSYPDHYWLYGLLFLIACLSFLYVPWAIFVTISNIRRDKHVDLENMQQEQAPVKPGYWFVSLIPFIMLASIVVWLSWSDDRYADLHEGRASRFKDGKWGYVDRRNKEVIPYMYDHASDFHDGRACVGIGERGNRKYGYIDRDGNIVIPLIYDKPAEFFDDIAYVTKDGKHGTIDKDGKELIPIIYDHVGFRFIENEGLAMVRQGDCCGFVRTNGDVVIPIVYEDAECYFSNELVRVKLHGQWGYLNRKGDVVIPMIYEEARNFNDGRAEVQLDMEKFYIDVNGRRIND